MSRDPADGNEPAEELGREELIRLVAELRTTIARQERTIARQAAAIAALQARPGVSGEARDNRAATDAGAGDAGGGTPPARPAAKPVPGFDYTVVFDGGAIGNPGRGYGSYQIVGAEGVIAEDRLELGDRVTNNQAEYRTLIRALEDLGERLGPAASQASVAIRGDSQLVIQTVTGRWKVRHPDLLPLHGRAVELLRGFGKTDVAWHRRGASVRVLGH